MLLVLYIDVRAFALATLFGEDLFGSLEQIPTTLCL